MDIDELFNFYGTDKQQYAAIYHALFKYIRERQLTILEIGIGTMIPNAPNSMVGYALDGYRPGGSLRAWRDYFPNAEIHGIDIQPDTQFENEERIHTHLCDSTCLDLVNQFIESQGEISFDIIIDDGSHFDMDQLTTLRNLFPHLKRGGYYIIEDVGPGSRLLTELFTEVRAVCDNDLLFGTEEKNYVVITRRL